MQGVKLTIPIFTLVAVVAYHSEEDSLVVAQELTITMNKLVAMVSSHPAVAGCLAVAQQLTIPKYISVAMVSSHTAAMECLAAAQQLTTPKCIPVAVVSSYSVDGLAVVQGFALPKRKLAAIVSSAVDRLGVAQELTIPKCILVAMVCCIWDVVRGAESETKTGNCL